MLYYLAFSGLAPQAARTQIHPLFYAVPVSVSCAIPVIMPVASFALTIAHAYSEVTYYDMVRRGRKIWKA